MTTNDPQKVLVVSAINFHTAIKAVQEFVEKYPIERLSVEQAKDLSKAAARIMDRLSVSPSATKRLTVPPIGSTCPCVTGDDWAACGKPGAYVVEHKGRFPVRGTPCTEHVHKYSKANGWEII